MLHLRGRTYDSTLTACQTLSNFRLAPQGASTYDLGMRCNGVTCTARMKYEICPEFRQFAGLLNLVEFVAGAFPVKTPVVPAFSPQQTLSAHLLYWTTAAGFAFMWWCDYKAYPKAQMRYSELPGVPVRPAWESPGIGRIGLERQLQ